MTTADTLLEKAAGYLSEDKLEMVANAFDIVPMQWYKVLTIDKNQGVLQIAKC